MRYYREPQKKNRTFSGALYFKFLTIPSENPYRCIGRVIRRLVSLTDRVNAMVTECDRRAVLMHVVNIAINQLTPHFYREEDVYRSYKELIRWIPTLRQVLGAQSDLSQLTLIYYHLTKGADGARGDDTSHLKAAVALWLNEEGHKRILARDKSGRGFHHDTTGELICPVDYDWTDAAVKEGIRSYHPDYIVSAYSWPNFLYEGKYNPNDPTKGLFKGKWLVKAFKFIFTSPTSTSELYSDDEEQPRKKQKAFGERSTRSSLRFAFSSCGSWRLADGNFDNTTFYSHIVDYFELPPTPQAKADINDLLLWWNRQVFGRTNVSMYCPQATQKLSVAISSARQTSTSSNLPGHIMPDM
ncbi:hypothetical protein BV22DRAFT_1027039 [Leucogyrophana mollusca]|uniref:Uncharacterized protein n=1 Tax=Leucogyrophana mollusca TaxID=85980 RepID=A0ACB8AUL1_9AGAM|nr:hypothetical protein BV22DRAFT_1027039 [Leucogyrophana mollusca]